MPSSPTIAGICSLMRCSLTCFPRVVAARCVLAATVVLVAQPVAVAVVVVAGGGAGDQDPGDGAVTGQPPARLGCQRPDPADLTPHRRGPGVALESL